MNRTSGESSAASPRGDRRLRFDRHELAGAFGDIGTDLPLLVGVILAAGLDAGAVLVVFGAMQILSGMVHRLPMPVQPLKAMAAIVIAQQVPAPVLYGAGIAIGLAMLTLTLTGLLDTLARLVPKCVVRGVQFGLGLQLASVALGKYVQADGLVGYALAAVAFALIVSLLGNRRLPAALPVIALGIVHAAVFRGAGDHLAAGFGLHVPALHVPTVADIATGFLLLALPQIPLSLGNSVLATRQLADDLFPGRGLTIRRLGLSYSGLNLLGPLFGGIPACHGSGGMAGHYAFGGRTGGSVILYGAMFLGLGLFFGAGFGQFAQAFSLPLLGVLLLFEALALLWMVRDVAAVHGEFPITLLVGLLAVGLPYGYVVGLVVGTALFHTGRRVRLVSGEG